MDGSAEAMDYSLVPQGRLPDFFIVGNSKSGTSALYHMLRRQPQIYMPDVKEPRFFSRSPDTPETLHRPATIGAYLSLFAPATSAQRVGEASPTYLFSPSAAARIAEVQPAARIIAILREPASFLRSFHLQAVRNHIENEHDLRKAIGLEQPRREGKVVVPNLARPRAVMYSQHVRYVEQLQRYYSAFPPEQILVLIYEDFRDDNESTVREVLRFLDVDDTGPIEVADANLSVSARSRRLDELVRSVYLGRGPLAWRLKFILKALVPRRLRRNALGTILRNVVYRKPGLADDELLLDLRRRFKPQVVELSEYLGRDLVSRWGYDSID